MAKSTISSGKSLVAFTHLGTAFLIVAALYFARDVFMPLALAILFSFLLNPVVEWLERRRIARVPAVIGAALLFFTILGGAIWTVGAELSSLAQDAPRYKTEVIRKARSLAGTGPGIGQKLESIQEELTDALDGNNSADTPADTPAVGPPEKIDQEQETLAAENKRAAVPDGLTPQTALFTKNIDYEVSPFVNYASSLGILAAPLGTASLVLVFTFFMMIYREDLRDRIIKIVSRGQYVTTTRATSEASQRISRYLIAQSIVNSTYGVVIGVGLWVIGAVLGGDVGFPNVLLWGFLCMVLRFVPYIGPVLAGAFPVLVSLAVFPGFSVFVATLVLIGTIELLSNNLMEPWLYGSSTGMSPMAVILAAVFWGWLWGPVGLLLATPLTVCLVVMGKHIPQFRIFTTLMGEGQTLPIYVQLYQRMLAGDYLHAEGLAGKYIQDHGLVSFLDDALLPVMRRVRKDKENQRLTSGEVQELAPLFDKLLSFIEQSRTPDEADTDSEKQDGIASEGPIKPTLPRQSVLGIPAHHEAEERALRAIGMTLDDAHIRYQTETTRSLPKTVEQRVTNENPAVVVIALIPPGGLLQAEFICKQLRSASEHRKIVVAYLGKPRNFDRLLIRLRKSGASYVTTSIEQTRLQVKTLLEA